MRHVVQHGLDRQRAKALAERAFRSYQERYTKFRPTLTWVSETRAEASFQALGLTLKGTIELEPGSIAFQMERVPLAARMFKQRALDAIEREIEHWLHQTK
ncbi:MAG: polyhydroxyalkanoic acid system family protein [Myxococcota bacterium]